MTARNLFRAIVLSLTTLLWVLYCAIHGRPNALELLALAGSAITATLCWAEALK